MIVLDHGLSLPEFLEGDARQALIQARFGTTDTKEPTTNEWTETKQIFSGESKECVYDRTPAIVHANFDKADSIEDLVSLAQDMAPMAATGLAIFLAVLVLFRFRVHLDERERRHRARVVGVRARAARRHHGRRARVRVAGRRARRARAGRGQGAWRRP